MNVLVLGNGFDIAHSLPTKYTDFILFLKVINKCNQGECINDIIQIYNQKMNELLKEWILNQENAYIEKYKNKFKDVETNCWYEYFNNKINYEDNIAGKWIDFESEISDVSKKILLIYEGINGGYRKKKPKPSIYIKEDFEFKNIEELMRYQYMGYSGIETIFKFNLNGLNAFVKKLIDDLHKFINILNYYMTIVNDITKRYGTRIDLPYHTYRIDKIISFNYTNTYRILYDKKFLNDDIFFIHGKATYPECASDNLVLGAADNNWKPDDNSYCIELNKTFQRLYQETSAKYFHFVNRIIKNKESINLYIYGLAMGMADVMLLKKLLDKCDNTTIYYHGEFSHNNVMKILFSLYDEEFIAEKIRLRSA